MADVLKTVQALIARAEHPNTPAPEAELALKQANKLMLRHAIDEATIRAGLSESERRKPVVEKWEGFRGEATEFSYYLEKLLVQVAEANRCKAVVSFGSATIIGFHDDVTWVKQLYMTIQLSLVTQMLPKWNPEDSVQLNIYRFKHAGYKWADIHYYGRRNGALLDVKAPPNDGGYMIRQYKAELKARGEQPVATQRFTAFRASFVAGFADQMTRRLREMAREARNEAKSSGAELVLRDAATVVQEAFYDEFPHMRPMSAEEIAAMEEQDRIRRAEEKARWEALTPAQKRKELEAEERRQKKNERDWAAYRRRQSARYDAHGMVAGCNAAENVNLTRSTVVDTNTRKALS